jgi:hypothetical protein
MPEDVDEGLGPSHCSPAKVCDFVYELELAVSFVTDECRLANPVEVTYEMRDGEGFMRVEPSPHHMLHRLWSSCVDKQGYNKEAWREVERQLKVAGIVR